MKKALPPEERALLCSHWLAKAGSAKERARVEQLVNSDKLMPSERAYFKRWLADAKEPDLDRNGKCNEAYWVAAKKAALGHAYDEARRRHARLPRHLFEVACLITFGFQNKDIAEMLGIGNRTVEKYKHKICETAGISKDDPEAADWQDGCDNPQENVLIAKWFLGL